MSSLRCEQRSRMNPSFPGELDNALWSIGREWCQASEPNCPECPMNEFVSKTNVTNKGGGNHGWNNSSRYYQRQIQGNQ